MSNLFRKNLPSDMFDMFLTALCGRAGGFFPLFSEMKCLFRGKHNSIQFHYGGLHMYRSLEGYVTAVCLNVFGISRPISMANCILRPVEVLLCHTMALSNPDPPKII